MGGSRGGAAGSDVRRRVRRVLRGFWRHSTSDPKSRRILGFLSLNLGFMFVELGVGYWSNSLGLVSDAGHMLFDCAALAIGLFAAYAARWAANDRYTYGYSRVEVLSGFVNGVFLIFIAFAVFTESLHRLNEPPEVHAGHLIWTSTVGLLINMVGLVFFHDFSHGGAHGHDCGHAHGAGVECPSQGVMGRDQSRGRIPSAQEDSGMPGPPGLPGLPIVDDENSPRRSPSGRLRRGVRRGGSRRPHVHTSDCSPQCPPQSERLLPASSASAYASASASAPTSFSALSFSFPSSSSADQTATSFYSAQPANNAINLNAPPTTDQNMRGIFLHVLADALGSVGVVISSILIRAFGWSIADPICSLMISVLILMSVVPLIQDTAWILLQHTPTRGLGSEPGALQRVLADIGHLKGVRGVACAHVWTVGGSERVATLHVDLDEVTMHANGKQPAGQQQSASSASDESGSSRSQSGAAGLQRGFLRPPPPQRRRRPRAPRVEPPLPPVRLWLRMLLRRVRRTRARSRGALGSTPRARGRMQSGR